MFKIYQDLKIFVGNQEQTPKFFKKQSKRIFFSLKTTTTTKNTAKNCVPSDQEKIIDFSLNSVQSTTSFNKNDDFILIWHTFLFINLKAEITHPFSKNCF